MPTLDPEKVLSISGVDSIVLGEGESALMEFLGAFYQGKDFSGIQNIWVKSPYLEFIKNPLRPLIEDADVFPFSDRSFYSRDRLLDITNGGLPMIASRGCAQNCLYCAHGHLKEIYRGKGEYLRLRSVNNVIGEILEQKARYSFSSVLFLDCIFPTNHNWLLEFAELFQSRVNLPLRISCSVDKLNKKTLKLLVMAGCTSITIAVKTGNEAFRRRICDFGASNEEIVKVVQDVKEFGIQIHTENIIGFPLETDSLNNETLEFNRNLSPSGISTSIYFPIPSTPFYKYCREKGYIAERSPLETDEGESILDLPCMSAEMIRNYYYKMLRMNGEIQKEHAGKMHGFIDLLQEFSLQDSVEAGEKPAICNQYWLGDESRLCLAQEPNTKLALPVKLKEKCYMHFGIGIEPHLRSFGKKINFGYIHILRKGPQNMLLMMI